METKPEPDILHGTPWLGATARPLAVDASRRHYTRLTNAAGRSAILAHDPQPASRKAFAAISRHLRGLGLSAPEVLATDDAAGLMLLEDLGDAVYPRVIAADPGMENSLYSTAIDALLSLSAAPPPAFPRLDAPEMARQTMVAFDWYAHQPVPGLQARLETLFLDELTPPNALMLRDVHAENLIWLPDRTGPARVGLLDFQDAMLCTPLYDVVSLVEDARRDVHHDLADQLYRMAALRLGRSNDDVRREAAVLSMQRNLRILGVFARLCLRDAKPGYLAFIPRVWGHIWRALDRLGDDELSRMLDAALPHPTVEHIGTLEASCGTIRTR